jgi:hypothetical protein
MDIIDLNGRRKHIVYGHRGFWKNRIECFAAILMIAMAVGCSKPQTTEEGAPPPVKKIPAGSQFSGFLKDYSALKHNPNMEGEMLTYVSADAK